MISSFSSYAAMTANNAAQEAMVEAIDKARNLGYTYILILCSSKQIVQVVNKARAPNWQE